MKLEEYNNLELGDTFVFNEKATDDVLQELNLDEWVCTGTECVVVLPRNPNTISFKVLGFTPIYLDEVFELYSTPEDLPCTHEIIDLTYFTEESPMKRRYCNCTRDPQQGPDNGLCGYCEAAQLSEEQRKTSQSSYTQKPSIRYSTTRPANKVVYLEDLEFNDMFVFLEHHNDSKTTNEPATVYKVINTPRDPADQTIPISDVLGTTQLIGYPDDEVIPVKLTQIYIHYELETI